jgi:hypothetical protein
MDYRERAEQALRDIETTHDGPRLPILLALCAEVAAEARREARQALGKYGQHIPGGCAVDRWMNGSVMRNPRPECTCGFDAALTAEEADRVRENQD